MKWNWELKNWPKFIFDQNEIMHLEKQFLLNMGQSVAFLNTINAKDREEFIIEMISLEGINSSKIEGEILDRKSLQSSIKKHFGLKDTSKKPFLKEAGIAKLLCSVYETFSEPLSHEILFKWHSMLFEANNKSIESGKYRSSNEAMQIVSSRHDKQKVFFEAPPSSRVYAEMSYFIDWFNSIKSFDSIFTRAAISHVYFESIHPFEDGNGRIGRVLVEKILSQGVDKPILIAISKQLEQNKKQYYLELGKCNHTLDIQDWIIFFSNSILEAQQESVNLLNFLIEKAKLLLKLSGKINHRQEKALLRMFAEGLEGFKGGLSADNYTKMTKASRATATRDLTELVHLGALFKTGELRHTRYWLNVKTP